MEIKHLNENPIVFYESTMKTIVKDDNRQLGTISYSNGYSDERLNFLANIAYLNEKGEVMLANDYFYNKGVHSFDRNDGVSIGYMIDNWSPLDSVIYTEKKAPEEFLKKIKSINFENAGYSRKKIESELEALVDSIWEKEDYRELALELGFRLAKFYITAKLGEPIPNKDYNGDWDHQIPLQVEDHKDLQTLFTLRNRENILIIKILDSKEKGPRIELETEKDKNLTLADMTPEGISEITDFLIEQSFHGPTAI